MTIAGERIGAALGLAVLCIALSGDAVNLPVDGTNFIEDAAYWRKIGMSTLDKNLKALKRSYLEGFKARNVIIFVGDGMGMTSITAGRIFKGQQNNAYKGEEASLVFDDFPNIGLAKTYNVDKQVPDSAGTATAIFTGVKTLYGAIGCDATCNRTVAGKLSSIMDWAQAAGKRTGIVTTTRITHATPAATYAVTFDRDQECDAAVPLDLKDSHSDIARQLVEQSPGNKLNVILGGGLDMMGNRNANEVQRVKFKGKTEIGCVRGDGRNLTDEWLHLQPTGRRQFVQTVQQLRNVDTKRVDYLMGLFRNNHLTYRIAAEQGEPQLRDMVTQAIKVLDRSKSAGYVLMVEGGRIDQAHHQNYARASMYEILEFDMAIKAALDLTSSDDTLIIVTADHSHPLTLNGYALRGHDILGFANENRSIPPYETLTYANGPGFEAHKLSPPFNTSKEEFSERRLSPTYAHYSGIYLNQDSHGGEDVPVYAVGPGAALIRGTFEQNYLAFVMSYVGCFGETSLSNPLCQSADKPSLSSGARLGSFNLYILFAILCGVTLHRL